MHSLEEIYQRLLALEQRLEASGIGQAPEGMSLVPAGVFTMGAATNVGHEAIAGQVPQHAVYVSAIYADRTEVSYSLWQVYHDYGTENGYSFDHDGSSKPGGASHPVHTVSWFDCVKWCNARSESEGLTPCYMISGLVYRAGNVVPDCDLTASGYRLPTEAEWEKAARGGACHRRFPWGDTIQHVRANYVSSPTLDYDTSATTGFHPTYEVNGMPYTSPVASFAPNGYGLFDMAGNVWEWCWDIYAEDYYSTSPGTDPLGPSSGANRVLRGGGWSHGANVAQCPHRSSNDPGAAVNSAGFRCVRKR